MATNKINFNTSEVTLSGVKWWNGTEFEQARGIILNGEVVVDFTMELKWSDYVNAYNAVWTSNDPTIETEKMAQMAQENEFAITRSRWLLYTRAAPFQEAGVTECKLFNFNADGKLYVGEALVANWEAIYNTFFQSGRLESMTITGIDKKLLTGLPLMYKQLYEGAEDNLNFASTGVIDSVSRGTDGNWELTPGNIDEIISADGNTRLKVSAIKDAINAILGTDRATGTGLIKITGTEKWDAQGICNFLCDVYLDGYGPYREDMAYLNLIPNGAFKNSTYWAVPPDKMFPIQVVDLDYYDTTNSIGCDFYVLTAWLNSLISTNVDLSYGYAWQGDNNALVNVIYFDTSQLAGFKYPNILVEMSCVFQQAEEPAFITDEGWIGTTDGYGYIFPNDCPYEVSPNAVAPQISADQWANKNNLGSITWNVNQTHEISDIGALLAPTGTAETVFNWYRENHADLFPSSGTGQKAAEFTLKLKMRSYPAYAYTGSVAGEDSNNWYLDAYDSYNVGGYYPVKKTAASVAGNMYKTTVNYTAQ